MAPAKKKPFPLSVTANISRSLKKQMVRQASRVDFYRLLQHVANSESGRPWLERFRDMPPCSQEAGAIKERAAELTIAQLAAEGQEFDPKVVRSNLDSIAMRYDREIHVYGAAAVVTMMNGFFSQHDPAASFLSPDRRELAHIGQLKAYREQGLGVAYLINHSSHLDEFLVAAVLAQEDLGLPAFATGDNMMAIESIARIFWVAAYVVRRRGADRAYMATLFNYCRAMAECGGQQSIFLEAWAGGARSRDGSLRYPRRLVTLRGALAGERELVIQPVAVSFSMVPEDLCLAARKGALTWIKGLGVLPTFGCMLAHPRSWLWRSIQGLYGRAYVTLPQPHLLSELKAAHAADRQGRELDEFVALTAISDIARSKKVMASQLTARGLQRARRQGMRDLNAATSAELEALTSYHLEAFGVKPDLEDFIRDNPISLVVADGLKTLRRRGVVWPLRRDKRRLPKVRSPRGLGFYATHGDRRLYSPTAQENLVVVGAGDWGFALTNYLGNRMLEGRRYLHASLALYDSRRELIEHLAYDRSPEGRFAEQRLPKNAFVTSDPPSAFKKASEVVVACPSEYLASQVEVILAHAEQGLKLVVASRGLAPEAPYLPVALVRRIAARAGRGDVAVYALGGAMGAGDLVEGRSGRLVVAGPAAGRDELAKLFTLDPVSVAVSDDPLGVNLAATLARVYGMWAGYLTRLGRLNRASAVGYYLADASAEAIALANALGGTEKSFSAASPAWSAAFAASGLGGQARDFGRRMVSQTRRGREPAAAAGRLARQLAEEGRPLIAWKDLGLAVKMAGSLRVEMPILTEAWETLMGGEPSS
ncbi:MAG: 1-acyl-sn-glycerol-3-phosphate acyltransferase [Proteobacteria bacterium]|nr:1-acyl-sn-glycerol-3-phosphate acyltransferase [Pseudomonadota bacterium]MBU1449708.1 1-acyl-sn-glycerol-3-phosphate acyltransferase [Pseudomonadota bacterium]MBU2468268.1 1-acyl-sn-glycerol-3-phosphate acyltransferase [Pseudomonadota bacterium]MBU2517102.1 1-acyl-sn-glycerol-3-phosphate acyltransferase [Pseudomonadota bacterium]